jgi:rod shape-determining protein MreB and related proteins
MSLFGRDVAVALVDDTFIFTTKTQEAPLVVPAYVAIQTGTTRVLACGAEAKSMLGKEPDNISVIRVLVEGKVVGPEYATALFAFGLKNLAEKSWLIRPRVIIACRVTDEPGKLAISTMATKGGARESYLIEMGMATAIGMRLEVQAPEIKAVLSISDDWFEFSVISLAGVLSGVSGAIGSQTFVEDIQNHLTLAHQFRPELETLAAQLHTGGVNPPTVSELPGWETWSGRSEHGRIISKSVSRDELTLGMMPSLVRLTERLKSAIRKLSNEKQYQLSLTKIHATGSALKISGLAQLISAQLGHPLTEFSADVHPSIEGAKTVLKELNFLARSAPSKNKRPAF